MMTMAHSVTPQSRSWRTVPALLLALACCSTVAGAQPGAAAAPTRLEQLQREAQQGSAAARYELAHRYNLGTGVALDREKSLQLYEQAAAAGHGAALLALSRHHRGQTGAPADLPRALDLLQQSAAKDHVPAQLELAFAYLNGSTGAPRDPAQAFPWFRKAAAAGSVTAQCMVADFYRDGTGGAPKDPKQAHSWYVKTAASTAPCASKSQFELYRLYEAGLGVRKDLPQALHWLQEAALAGNPLAQRTLGQNYARGYGVPQDGTLAQVWLKRSREGVAPHDDHEHEMRSFSGPRMAASPLGR